MDNDDDAKRLVSFARSAADSLAAVAREIFDDGGIRHQTQRDKLRAALATYDAVKDRDIEAAARETGQFSAPEQPEPASVETGQFDKRHDSQPREPTLLPCPFCGSDASITKNFGVYVPGCNHCGVSIGSYSSARSAATVWNRRAAPAAADQSTTK